MRKLIHILIIATYIFSFEFGNAQNLSMSIQKPTESFNIREAKGIDFYKIMVVNESLKNYKEKNKYPWLLLLTVHMIDTFKPYDLPTDKEAEILNKMEDKISSIIENTVPYQFIGRITDAGIREIYYYVETPDKIHEKLAAVIKLQDYEREFQYEISQDPEWESVNFFFDY